jgi:hypothetical protein
MRIISQEAGFYRSLKVLFFIIKSKDFTHYMGVVLKEIGNWKLETRTWSIEPETLQNLYIRFINAI